MNLSGSRKYTKVFKRLVKLELMTDLQYRLNFLFVFLSTTAWLFAEILLLQFLVARYDSIAGWNIYQLAFLVGVNQLWVGGAFYFIIWPSLASFAQMIKTGASDKLLTLPINTRFYISVHKINWTSLTICLNGILLCIYCVAKLQLTISFEQIMLFGVFIFISTFIVYCIQFIATCITFWLINAGSFLYIVNTVDRLSRFPYEIYLKGVFFFAFTFVLPIAVISNVPARIVFGTIEVKFLVYALVVAIMLYVISSVLWKKGLRRYESASS